MTRRLPFALLSWLALLILVVGLACQSPSAGAPVQTDSQGMSVLDEAIAILREDYVDPSAPVLADPALRNKAAIQGILDELDDPYTSYLDKEERQLWESSFAGSFEGIGATVDVDDGRFSVTAPIAGSPAEQAGVRAGDWIQQVDGRSTDGLSVQQAILLVRGPRGSQVTLTILHQGDSQPVEITIIRDTIKVPSLTWEMKDGVAHVRLSTFGERSAAEMQDALREIQRLKATGLVLDLRHNPGGLLEIAIQIASQFLKDGLVLYEGDNKGGREPVKVRPGGLATDIPMVVLVDNASASASEVVAGALRDHARATIIGATTVGKGSINQVHDLSDGSALMITIARWYTPNGDLIQGKGITPDVTAERTPEDVKAQRDPPLDKALEVLRQNTAVQP